VTACSWQLKAVHDWVPQGKLYFDLSQKVKKSNIYFFFFKTVPVFFSLVFNELRLFYLKLCYNGLRLWAAELHF